MNFVQEIREDAIEVLKGCRSFEGNGSASAHATNMQVCFPNKAHQK